MRRLLSSCLVASACGGSPGAATGDALATSDACVGDTRGPSPDAGTVTSGLTYRGVNLAGADFGAVGGAFGTAYTYPDAAYVPGYTSPAYFLGRGMNTFRLPFLWERMQPTLGGALDAAEFARLDQTVTDLTTAGAFVVLDPHNYARYNGNLIGSPAVPNARFAQFWGLLAAKYATNAHVIFGLMNEPHDLPTEQWRDAANAAIVAIRAAGATNLITVPGNAYTGAHSWTQTYYGTANSVAMLAITDSGDNVAFEVHQYLDADFSGTSAGCTSPTVGADTLAAFTAWLRANKRRGFLGEFGGGANATCATAIDGMLSYVEANRDVYLGWTWWAAGPWWGASYILNLEPTSTGDAPQLATLAKHLHP